MKKLAPFLKLYTEYVQNYDTASNLVDTWLNKSSEFSKLVKDVQVSEVFTYIMMADHPEAGKECV